MTGGIAPKEDGFDFDKGKKAVDEKAEVKAVVPAAKKKKDQGFGGFASGFLNSQPKKKAAPKPKI
jgi:hypothetical protein